MTDGPVGRPFLVYHAIVVHCLQKCFSMIIFAGSVSRYEIFKIWNLYIQKHIMKFKSLLVSAAAAVFAVVACQEVAQDLGAPDISLSESEMTFEVAGGDQELTLNATRDWKVETDADWVVVSPESGKASAEDQKVTVSVLENEGMDRTADLKFTIGMKSKYLTVSQAGPGGSADALVIYANDMNKDKVVKDGNYWPYPDATDSWRNETGSGIANVKYASNDVSVRSVSSTNNLWFPAKGGSYFSIQDIELGSTSSMQLTFDVVHGSPNGYKKVFAPENFKVFLSPDNAKWVELPYELVVKADNEFDSTVAKFTVSGTSKLSIAFQFLGAEDGYRLTNINLSVYAGTDATAVDFSKATAMDFGSGSTGSNPGGSTPSEGQPTNLVKATIAEFLAAAESTTVWYELTGEIISIAKADYGNFTIKDATGEVYIYGMTSKWVGSNDKSFSQIGLKVGDTVTLGSLRTSYNGTPQGGGNPVPAYYISHVPGQGGTEPTPPAGEAGEYDSSLTWTLGANAYDATSQTPQKAVVNGVMVNNILKLGKSSAGGSATIAVPAGTAKVGFYAVGWTNNKVVLKCTAGSQSVSLNLNANSGATGNPDPTYEFTVTAADYYTVDIPSGATSLVLETSGSSNCRAVIFAIKAVN